MSRTPSLSATPFLPVVTTADDPRDSEYLYEDLLGRGAYASAYRVRVRPRVVTLDEYIRRFALKVIPLSRDGESGSGRLVAPSESPRRQHASGPAAAASGNAQLSSPATNAVVSAREYPPPESPLYYSSKDRVESELGHMKSVSNHFAFPRLMGTFYWRPESTAIAGARDHALVLMELCDAGELAKVIASRVTPTALYPLLESDIHIVFAQLMVAINHLHRRGAIHRDIKSGNILQMKPHRPVDPERPDFLLRPGLCKLSDFGFATLNREPSTKCGTYEFMAPELFDVDVNVSHYTNKIDIWSAGIVMYQCVALQLPFTFGRHGTFERVRRKLRGSYLRLGDLDFADRYNLLHPDLFSTIELMMAVDVNERPSAEQLLKSSFGRVAIENFCRWILQHVEGQDTHIEMFVAMEDDDVPLPAWLTEQLQARRALASAEEHAAAAAGSPFGGDSDGSTVANMSNLGEVMEASGEGPPPSTSRSRQSSITAPLQTPRRDPMDLPGDTDDRGAPSASPSCIIRRAVTDSSAQRSNPHSAPVPPTGTRHHREHAPRRAVASRVVATGVSGASSKSSTSSPATSSTNSRNHGDTLIPTHAAADGGVIYHAAAGKLP